MSENKSKKSKTAIIIAVAAVIIAVCCVIGFSAPKESGLEIGSSIEFGTLNTEEGSTPIQWLVIGEKDGMNLLLSRDCLAAMAYDSHEDASQNWAGSSLREYLNGEFLSTSFTEEEQKQIAETQLQNAFELENGSEPSMDKVFILSDEEINLYVPEEMSKEWLRAGFASQEDSSAWWWLRAPGYIETYAAVVKTNGVVYSRGDSVINELGGVRPAIWVKAQ